MPIPLDEQLQHFDRHCQQAYVQTLKAFKVRKPEILAEARKRMQEGYAAYGDTSFHKTYDQLRREELEEMADAIVYRLMRIRNGWPT